MASSKFSSSEVVLELLRVISKPTFKRTDHEVKLVLPWLKKRSAILQNLDNNVLLDIVKNCSVLSTFKDDVIIKQGDRGDSFYVILRGSTSVYIDPRLTGEGAMSEDAMSRTSARKKVKKPPKAPESEVSILSGMEKVEDSAGETSDGALPIGSGEDENPEAEDEGEEDTGQMIKKPQKLLAPLDRNKFGKFIVSYGTGHSFGEVALVNKDTFRNASVIADEDTDLLVIDQDLFDRSLRAEQEARYAEIRDFIEEHPFFREMSTKFKKLLEMSIRKEKYIFDTYIIRQGDPVEGLHFIIKGSANVIVQPKKHQTQYAHLWPFEAGVDQIAIEFEHLREARRAAILRKYEDPAVWETKPEELVIRREQGYAAIEKKMKENHINLCSVQTREVLGDVETLINLSTYMQTVRCSSDTTCFVLDTKNFERLVSNKKNTSNTMDVMREYVKNKLHTRMQMRQAELIPLLGYLHQKLTEQMLPQAKKVEPFKTSKSVPPVDEEMQHLLQYFRDGKEVVLIKPSIPGVVYYKELMREKAKVREQQRKAKVGDSIKLGSVYKSRHKRQPRSMLQIRESLKQMMEAEVIELEAKKFRKKRAKKKGSSADSQVSERSNHPGSPKTLIGMNKDKPASSEHQKTPRKAKRDIDSDNRSTPVKQSPRVGTDSPSSKLASNPNLPKSVPPVFVTEVSKSEIKLPAIREEKTQEEIVLKTGTEPNTPKPAAKPTPANDSSTNNTSTNEPVTQNKDKRVPDVPDAIIIDPSTRKKKSDRSSPSVAESNAELGKGHKTPRAGSVEHKDSVVPSEDFKAMVPNLPALGGSTTSLHQESQESGRTDNTDVSENWKTAITFVNQRIQDRLTQALSEEETDYKDYETSEPSLKLLENRIQAFHIKYGMGTKTKNLPPLKRYKLDTEEVTPRPKPGGRVLVKRQMCKFNNTEYVVKDHKHVRYRMVDHIPQYDRIHKQRVVLQQFLKTADYT